jgi:RimJ/RimL family protein N-acetyltransferase
VLKPEAVTLTGQFVRLAPLARSHFAQLVKVGADPALWRFGLHRVTSESDVLSRLEEMLSSVESGTSLPFAVVHVKTAHPVGFTRYSQISLEHSTLEIGSTWIGQRWQRSGVNTEAKYLMLRHAFEQLGCIRVQFRADSRNDQSRHALEGIGAVYEGTLRQHMLTYDGIHRDTVYYSILAGEWPDVETRLQGKLSRA